MLSSLRLSFFNMSVYFKVNIIYVYNLFACLCFLYSIFDLVPFYKRMQIIQLYLSFSVAVVRTSSV